MHSRFLEKPLSHYASTMSHPYMDGRVGKLTDDRSAVIGKDGWLFIYQGGNHYRTAYIQDTGEREGERWASLIESRQRLAESFGMKILHLVIPNKLTLLPQYFPESLPSSITYPLSELIASKCNADILVPVQEMRSHEIAESLYRRNDSHLTVAGNSYITDRVLDCLGLRLPAGFNEKIQTWAVKRSGDLGLKFQQNLEEIIHAPDVDRGFLDQSKLTKVSEVLNPPGHVGSKASFVNPTAPIKKKIVVFGNSFFSLVPSWGLSPFFAALFSEFHFIWSHEVDFLECRNIGADIVLFQTCERFLPRVPSK